MDERLVDFEPRIRTPLPRGELAHRILDRGVFTRRRTVTSSDSAAKTIAEPLEVLAGILYVI